MSETVPLQKAFRRTCSMAPLLEPIQLNVGLTVI